MWITNLAERTTRFQRTIRLSDRREFRARFTQPEFEIPGEFRLIPRPDRSGWQMSDRISGKKSTSLRRAAITAGVLAKARSHSEITKIQSEFLRSIPSGNTIIASENRSPADTSTEVQNFQSWQDTISMATLSPADCGLCTTTKMPARLSATSRFRGTV